MNTVIEIILTLAFVFLTYSILTMIVVEIFAGIFNLRARNLKLAVRRMLQDSDHKDDQSMNFFTKMWRLIKPESYERKFVKQFFDQPMIKYLGKNGYYKTPSYISPKDFSKNLVDILTAEPGYNDLNKIEQALDYDENFDQRMSFSYDEWMAFNAEFEEAEDKQKHIDDWLSKYKSESEIDRIEFTEIDLSRLELELNKVTDPKKKLEHISSWKKSKEEKIEIEPETLYQLRGLYKNAGGDVEKFKALAENWFNSTMDRSIGWYKKKISIITFVAGLFVAVVFNVDTINMTIQLKGNTALREQLLAKIESSAKANPELKDYVASYQQSKQDINETLSISNYENFRTGFAGKDGTFYKFPWLLAILGWLITGVAISFGAPFWFDILNKFMRIRSTGTQEKTESATAAAASPSTKKSTVPGSNRKG